MDNSHSASRRATDTQPYYANAIGKQVTSRNLSKERAQRLYAIGELKTAALVLSELAAGKHLRRATDLWEPPNG